MADLQDRLAALSYHSDDEPRGRYGAQTAIAVRRFQADRGLRPDGVCGPQTWSALVEAGYRLGDRLLYRRIPMLRGDDVAELQERLGALGFDAGRVDGIFGDNTAQALTDFQRNAGLTVDGILGRATRSELVRLGSRNGPSHLVAAVRERERLRQGPRTLQSRTVAIGHDGSLGVVASALARVLGARGAQVVDLSDPDGSRQAQLANAAGADLYLGLRVDLQERSCTAYYYSGFRHESAGGRRLAELVQERLPEVLGAASGGIRGMSFPILRETRMPAVLCELGEPSSIVRCVTEVAEALCAVLERWAGESWE